jgi:hypothetical protein
MQRGVGVLPEILLNMAAGAQLPDQENNFHSFSRAKLDIDLNLNWVISFRDTRTFKMGFSGKESSEAINNQKCYGICSEKSRLQNKVTWLGNSRVKDIAVLLVTYV